MEQWLIQGALAAGVAVLWYLLQKKDAAQEDQIKLLFKKHDDDAAALQDLRVEIAKQHYVKGELDTKFDRMERTFSDGFKDMGDKFDRLSNALIQHMTQEERK